MKLARYPFITGGEPVIQKRNETRHSYDPYNQKNIELLIRAYSIEADKMSTEYALNDSTWD